MSAFGNLLDVNHAFTETVNNAWSPEIADDLIQRLRTHLTSEHGDALRRAVGRAHSAWRAESFAYPREIERTDAEIKKEILKICLWDTRRLRQLSEKGILI